MSDTEEVARLKAEIEHCKAQLKTYKSEIYKLKVKLQAYENPAAASRNAVAPTKSDCNTSFIFHDLHPPNLVPSHLPNGIWRASQSHLTDTKTIPYHSTKPGHANKRKNPDSESQQPSKKGTKGSRGITPGMKVLKDIKKVQSSIESFPSQRFDLSVQGSVLERGMTLSARIKDNQDNEVDTTFARTEMFFFFSALLVLKKRNALSLDNILQFMDASEIKTKDYRHRCKIILGTVWLHEKVIFNLYKKGWKIEHAIAIIALISPGVSSDYEHIRSECNAELILGELQQPEDYSQDTEHIGKLLFKYIRLWDPSLEENSILRSLYPKLTSTRPQGSYTDIQLNQNSQSHEIMASSSSSTSKLLLNIIHALAQEGFVDYSLLTYASTKRKRWTASGELEDFSIGEMGSGDAVADILCDNKKLDHELHTLRSQGLIEWSDGRICISHEFVIEWSHWRQASHLLCFYFTGCEYSDKFSAVGNLVLPRFQRFVRAYKQQPEDYRQALRKLVLPAIIQASKFSDLAWKKECIVTLDSEGLQAMDDYTKASFVVRKAFVLRSDGQWDRSSEVIEEQLGLMKKKLDPRLNAVRGLLIHSLASNLWERELFDEASDIWKKWEPPLDKHMTLFETRVATRILMGNGKMMLHQGNFKGARASLKSALRQYDKDLHPHLDALATLSDVYCELGKPQNARDLLRPYIERNKDQNNRYYRNCYISYAESLIWTHHHKESEKLLINLKHQFEQRSQLDRHDQRRYIRVMLQLAQNQHLQADNPADWMKTVALWDNVIESMEQFVEVSSRDRGVIYISMHDATLRAGIKNSEWFEKGTNGLRKPGRHWMRGVGTYWWDYIHTRLPHVVTAA